ncbi:MAG: response regulator, partial [Polyangiales bacterium]
MTLQVLLTHGDEAERRAMRTAIRARGHGVVAVRTVDEVLSRLRERAFDCIVVGTARDREPHAAAERILRAHPTLDVIVVSSDARIEGIVEAFDLRVADYVPGPLEPKEVAHAVHRLWEQRAIANLL